MPQITAAGTYTKDDDGFGFLKSQGGRNRTFLFAGDSLPSGSLVVQYTDDQGVDRTLGNGTIDELPKSVEVGLLAHDLKIVATGGVPNFNVTNGGTEGVY